MIPLALPESPPAIVFHLPRPPALDVARMADAIRAVENSGVHQRGRRGEHGAWQFKPSRWREVSHVPQWSATEQQQRDAAIEHVRKLCAELARNGYPATPFFVALAHNLGLRGAMRKSIPAAKADFAERVKNLYDER